ncbi:TetR/AcrR family transcriptional regulator [Urechidicola vernalis]|uniref:TetR/AcrR family transcriptional regulator n=1 Tax=Urechidicola vernalis TaxID=3075600 RepID=A0ABU2Y8L8_9FLAO|nr:TetR/AcrR family transcriptional regulator [Urechidicola sp. P050]MDT0554087.1 TetR/AcrR family transcriptional regulator [Urechidicola sp. P050]
MPRTLNHSYPELVEKAQKLFWVKGYKSVSPEELAEHLEVSKSTIYNKYTRDMLFMDSLKGYVVDLSDPILEQVRNSDKGIEAFRDFFYMIVDGLLEKSFPKSCFMVNTVVELRNEKEQITELYERYFGNMRKTHRTVLETAIKKGEIKYPERIDEYTECMVGVLFSLSILYKVKSREELRTYVDEQIALLV